MFKQQLASELFSQGDALDLEAIDAGANPDFGPALEKEINRLREKRVTAKAIKESALADIVEKYTGISSTIKPMADDYNAYAMYPILTQNHPLFIDNGTRELVKEYLKPQRPKKGKPFNGGVNLRDGRVTGDIKDIEHEMGIGIPFFNDDGFDTKEIVAILLHEVGHLFTYYEFMIRSFSTNFLLQDFAEEVFKVKDYERRLVMCGRAGELSTEIKNAEMIAEAESVDEIRVILFNNEVEDAKSSLGVNVYDVRAWEQLADQFAARLGYGRYIVTGLDRMYDTHGMRPSGSRFQHIVMQSLLFLFSTMIYGLSLLVLALVDFQAKVYDDPQKRFEVVRKQLVSELRKTKDNEKKKVLIKDIEVIDTVIVEYKDYANVFEFFQRHFGPSGRGKYRSITTQQLLEELANSDLNVLVAKIESH